MMQGSKVICKKNQFVCMPFFSKCVTFGSVGGDNLSGVRHLCKPRVNIMLFFSSREVEENRNSQCKVYELLLVTEKSMK